MTIVEAEEMMKISNKISLIRVTRVTSTDHLVPTVSIFILIILNHLSDSNLYSNVPTQLMIEYTHLYGKYGTHPITSDTNLV